MFQDQFSIKAYDFLRRSELFRDEMDLQWLTRFVRMVNRGWVYTSMDGEELTALAGAYRIQSAEEALQSELPEKEQGSILFISFFISEQGNTASALKALKAYLRRNPDVRSVLYYKKSRDAGGPSYHLVRRPIIRRNEKGVWLQERDEFEIQNAEKQPLLV